MQLAADEDFAVFVRARQQALVRAAYLVCGDHHAAQDLVQGALAKLAARWEQVRLKSQASAGIGKLRHLLPQLQPASRTGGEDAR